MAESGARPGPEVSGDPSGSPDSGRIADSERVGEPGRVEQALPAAAQPAAAHVKVVRRRRKAAVPDVPLGSLSQPQGAIAGPLTCAACSSTALTRLVVANLAGVPAVFVSCHDCERSGWYAVDGGHEVTRQEVTAVAAEPDVAEPVVTPET